MGAANLANGPMKSGTRLCRYGPVDIIDLDDTKRMVDHGVRAVHTSEGCMSNGKRSAERVKQWACVAGSTFVLSGLLWVVAYCFTSSSHTPPAAGHITGLTAVRIYVEPPQQKATALNVTKAAHPHGNVEWVVVNTVAKVRISNSLTAKQIGAKAKGAIVIGEKQGDWVKLAHTDGWIVTTIGGYHILQKRAVNYFHIQIGLCGDLAGAFSIDDKDACVAAADYLGYQTHFRDVETYKGKAQRPHGCYAEGQKILFVPGQASCGGHGGCNNSLLKRPRLWEPLCSNGSYPLWMSGNGYMDSSAIATRVAVNNKRVAKVFKACPLATQCTILWPASINDFVRIGFGAAVAFFSPARAYFATIGCKLVVGKGFASHWRGTGFTPFWSEELTDTMFQQRWNQGMNCGGMYWMNHFKPEVVKCEMPPAFISDSSYEAYLRTPQYNGQLFKGWPNLYLQSFGPRLSAYRAPYNHSYAAFHVRTGDKMKDILFEQSQTNLNSFQQSGNVEGLLAILNQHWPHISSVFIATDDSNAVEQASKAVQGKYNMTWSANAARYPGGTPMAQYENHASNDGAVNGVLDDQAGLSIASVLIGASDSGFFNVARLLNVALHNGRPRLHPWCYDVYRHKICD